MLTASCHISDIKIAPKVEHISLLSVYLFITYSFSFNNRIFKKTQQSLFRWQLVGMTTQDDESFTSFKWIYPNPILKTWITLCTLEGSCSHASYMCSVYTEELPLRKEWVVWALSERVCTLAQVLWSRIPRVCGLERPEINVFTRYIFTSFWNASVFSCDKIYTYAQKPAWRFFDKSPQAQHARSNSHPRTVAVLFPRDK